MNDVSESTDILIGRIDGISLAAETGLRARLRAIGGVPAEWDGFLQALATHSLGFWSLLALILVAVAVAGLVFHGLSRWLGRLPGRLGGPVLRGIVAAVATALLVVVTARLTVPDETVRQVLRVWVIATVLCLLVRRLLVRLMIQDVEPSEPTRPLVRFANLLSVGAAWGLFGVATIATLRQFAAGGGIRDVTGTFLVSLPVTAMLAFAYWRYSKAVTRAVAGPEPWSPWRARFARLWPALAILALVGTAAILQIAATLGRPVQGLPMLGTLLLVLVAPHIDSAIGIWSEVRARAPQGALVATALRSMARFAFAVLVIVLLGYQWALPALTALGFDVSLIRAKSIEILLVALVGAFLWSITAAGIERLSLGDDHGAGDEDGHAPRTRIETLVPLLGGTAKVSILVLTVLTVLVILDINVWPLITGLSVFGLAIGFGSQTLVKDIVSGLFFLLDDAFRIGEYIETSGAKGTVEKISVRSVSLRHPRGAIATIPYGQIGKIQNYSRDWVIEKLVFRVAFDTDVEKVRKLFKQIGQQIAEDPELSQDLLETFKSQGISSVEDGTLLVRGKFKAKAGKQFGIRKAVLSAVQRTFQENGILAVPKPVVIPGAGAGGPGA